MKNFKELRIWQKGIDIAVRCYKLTATFPVQEKYNIVSQINRAGVSISSNIAEGSSRFSEKDYNRFIEISLGSCFELETQLMIAQKFQMGNQELLTQTLLDVQDEEKMITGFMSKLNK
jgi:four helix bundle protein